MYKVAVLPLIIARNGLLNLIHIRWQPQDGKAGAFLPNGSRSVFSGEQPKTKKAQNKALTPHSGLIVSVPDIIAYSDTYKLN
jgi:hypothetical protein